MMMNKHVNNHVELIVTAQIIFSLFSNIHLRCSEQEDEHSNLAMSEVDERAANWLSSSIESTVWLLTAHCFNQASHPLVRISLWLFFGLFISSFIFSLFFFWFCTFSLVGEFAIFLSFPFHFSFSIFLSCPPCLLMIKVMLLVLI